VSSDPLEDDWGIPDEPDPTPSRPGSTTRGAVIAIDDGQRTRRNDRLATEEPMEIRVEEPSREQRSIAVTMRTPGHDFELAVGFLFTEGLITSIDDVRGVRYCTVPADQQQFNVVSVTLTRELPSVGAERNFYATSSCGVCGKASLDMIETHASKVADGPTVATDVVLGLPDTLRAAQKVFETTGGLHGAALFSESGELLALREDVGRHNAVDKIIGERFLASDVPLSARVLLVSGRASFEIVQKAAMAGIPVICAVSAPSSLAVDAARRFGITLIGFLRGNRFNIYTGPERIE
jgi:FdhD protein